MVPKIFLPVALNLGPRPNPQTQNPKYFTPHLQKEGDLVYPMTLNLGSCGATVSGVHARFSVSTVQLSTLNLGKCGTIVPEVHAGFEYQQYLPSNPQMERLQAPRHQPRQGSRCTAEYDACWFRVSGFGNG